MKTLSIVIPCFNNAENIADLQTALEKLSTKLSNYMVEIILVDDGSIDNTYDKLLDFSNTSTLKTKIVKLTGNFGSYNAFLAGLNYGNGDVYAQVHPDLQDPPEHLEEMLPYWEKGIKFVIGQRIAREDKDTSQHFARLYHRLMKKIALPHIPDGGYDLILFDKELRNHVVEMNESNTNLVYLISWLKYPYTTVPITRVSRKTGTSQWTLSKKIKLLIDSVVSFSYAPIRFISFSSIVIFIVSIIFFLFLLFCNRFTNETKITLSIFLFFGNMLLIFLSIIGEYLWRTLEFSRKRPPFIVDKEK